MSSARTPLMAGNWKMNLNHFEAIAHVQKIAYALNDKDHAAVEVAVLAPFTDLRSIQTLVDGDKFKIKYGAQDVSKHESGAYHGETDAEVAAKAAIALKHAISPIICFGEKLHVRQENGHLAHCEAQLNGSLAGLTAEQVRTSVLAYEPVWAIGTGEVATPADAQEVIGAIRGRLAELYDAETAEATRILYGGSVKGSNAAGIMAEKDVDGALIGGASLDPDDFVRIVRYRDSAVA